MTVLKGSQMRELLCVLGDTFFRKDDWALGRKDGTCNTVRNKTNRAPDGVTTLGLNTQTRCGLDLPNLNPPVRNVLHGTSEVIWPLGPCCPPDLQDETLALPLKGP